MKKNAKIVALVASGLAGLSAAQASDLLLGFNDAAGPTAAQNDYVIDLGYSGTALITAANADGGTINLSSVFNSGTYSTAFSADASAANDVAVGVVGASSGSPKYLFQTANGKPAVTTPGQFANSTGSAQTPPVGEYGSTASPGWSFNVAVSPTKVGNDGTGDDVADQTGNPLGQLSGGAITLNLWGNTETGTLTKTVGGWVNEGTFAIDPGTDAITFSTVAVPEPSTYGLLSGAGLLAVSLRNKLGRQNA